MAKPAMSKASSLPALSKRIEEMIGLDLATLTTRGIQHAVNARCQALGVPGSAEYLALLDSTPQELQQLVDEVVVPETWFQREPEAIELMVILARQAKRSGRRRKPFRILSVPCSGGEEPYSLVMAMLDAGFSSDEFVVLAADVSRRSLRRAEKGIYPSTSFRGATLGFRSRYFDLTSEGYQLQESVRSKVTFYHDNILSSLFLAAAEPVDFLFCRNLFIYFQPDTRKRPLEHLLRLMRPEAYLFCGVAEYRCFDRAPFRLERVGSIYACRIQPGAERAAAPGFVDASRGPRHLSPPASGPLRGHADRAVPEEATQIGAKLGCDRDPRDLELRRAQRLADEGAFEESAAICESLLRGRMDSVEAFSLLALIRGAQGRLEESMQLYRKALYLDPEHQESLVHLALLRERLGDAEGAEMLRARARKRHVTSKPMP